MNPAKQFENNFYHVLKITQLDEFLTYAVEYIQWYQLFIMQKPTELKKGGRRYRKKTAKRRHRMHKTGKKRGGAKQGGPDPHRDELLRKHEELEIQFRRIHSDADVDQSDITDRISKSDEQLEREIQFYENLLQEYESPTQPFVPRNDHFIMERPATEIQHNPLLALSLSNTTPRRSSKANLMFIPGCLLIIILLITLCFIIKKLFATIAPDENIFYRYFRLINEAFFGGLPEDEEETNPDSLESRQAREALANEIFRRLTRPPAKLFNDGTCSICIDDFQENRDIVISKCGHLYHKNCFREFIHSTSSSNIICPICKAQCLPLADGRSILHAIKEITEILEDKKKNS